MSPELVMVTGAAGFIGNAVRLLLEHRGAEVIAVDRISRTEGGHENVVCDLIDVHRLHSIVHGRRVSAIVHCGAFSGPMVARDNPYSMIQVNVLGTANLLEIARLHEIPRMVFCSSASAYGNTPPGPVPEDVLLSPTNVYAATKVASEHLVASYARSFSVDAVSLRLSWVYGPRRNTECVIRTMIENALSGKPTRLPYGHDFYRQFVHIDDAARSVLAALDRRNLPRLTYTITGGTYVTLGEIAEMVKRVLPRADIRLSAGPDPEDDRQDRFDISAAERDLNYRPSVSLEDGIRSYAAWLASRSQQVAAA